MAQTTLNKVTIQNNKLTEIENFIINYPTMDWNNDYKENLLELKRLHPLLQKSNDSSETFNLYKKIISGLYFRLVDNESLKSLYTLKEVIESNTSLNKNIELKARIWLLANNDFMNLDSNYVENFYEEALALKKRTSLSLLDTDMIHYYRAYYFSNNGKFLKAINERKKTSHPVFYFKNLRENIFSYSFLGQYDKALEMYNIIINDKDISESDKAKTAAYLGSQLLNTGDYQLIIDMFGVQAKNAEHSLRNSCSLKYIVANAYSNNLDHESALNLLNEIIQSEDYKNYDKICIQASLNSVMSSYLAQNDFKKYKETLSRYEQDFSNSSPNSILNISHDLNKANYELKTKNYKKAFALFKNIDATVTKKNKKLSDGNKQKLLSGLSQSALNLGLPEESAKYYETFKDYFKKKYEKKSSESSFANKAVRISYEKKLLEEKVQLGKIEIALLEEENKNIKLLWVVVLSGLVLFVVLVFWYLSKKSKEKLQIANVLLDEEKEEVTKLVVEREKLLAHITHQSKTPLVQMSYMVDLMDKLNDEKDKNKLKKHLKTSLNSINRQMEDILSWIKTVLNTDIQTETVKPKLIVEELIEENFELIKNKNLLINNSFDDNYQIITNKAAFKIILTNLLTNAIKYSFKDGSISFENNLDTIIVKGDGEKVPQNIIESLKVKNNPMESKLPLIKSTLKGSGLGLYLVRDLCDKLKIGFNIYNDIDFGTTNVSLKLK